VTQKVAILGCGPAGLLVAHAAAMSGWDFRIYSRKRKSMLEGAQYLHEAIPGMTVDEPVIVDYILEGSTIGYRQKVYGKDYTGPVSPEELGSHTQYAWDIHACYDRLWDAYSDEVREIDIKWSADGGLQKHLGARVDLVISTISRRVFDDNPGNFTQTDVWVVSDNPEIGKQCPFGPRENTVLCDGTEDVGWYRTSNLFGRKAIEWPGNLPKPPVSGIVKVGKPIAYEGNSAPDFVHLGRYAQWRKGVLTTDAFEAALKLFAGSRQTCLD
jgi:hypothetical protein